MIVFGTLGTMEVALRTFGRKRPSLQVIIFDMFRHIQGVNQRKNNVLFAHQSRKSTWISKIQHQAPCSLHHLGPDRADDRRRSEKIEISETKMQCYSPQVSGVEFPPLPAVRKGPFEPHKHCRLTTEVPAPVRRTCPPGVNCGLWSPLGRLGTSSTRM